MLNILITAVGGELALSIIKAAKLMNYSYRLIGCDIYPEAVGKYWCDRFYQVPLGSNEFEYIKSVENIILENEINVVIPGSDSELLTLSKYKNYFKLDFDCSVLANDYTEANRFFDKWNSYNFFIEQGIACPKTILIDDRNNLERKLEAMDFPLILKPRKGGGSRAVFRIDSLDEAFKHCQIYKDSIFQEYLHPDEAEYTAGTYKNLEGKVIVIIMKRSLKFGMTNTAEIVQDSGLEKYCQQVISKTKLLGSNNIQFRNTSQGPKILEINPRFSGTSAIRANFGFNDVKMWVDEVCFQKIASQPKIKQGFVLRYMHEQYHFADFDEINK